MATTRPGPQRFVSPHGAQNVTTRDQWTSAIRELAERQHGVVAWRQLIALGLGGGAIRKRVVRGTLLPQHRGVFAVGHRRIGQKGSWMAAVLAAGPGAVLSHGSAAHLWGVRRSRGLVEVTRLAGHRRPHGIRLHQTRSLSAEDVVIEAGIPVTSLERTTLDIAGRLDARQMERFLVDADRSGRLSWPTLRRVVERPGGRKGAGRLRRLIDQVDPHAVDARSPLEVDFLALCREAGLPSPQVNVFVEGALVDFYWPRARVIVETDGYAYHNDRLSFERDHESTVVLEAAGYRVHRVTYRMLKRNPDPFLRLVRLSLEGAVPNGS